MAECIEAGAVELGNTISIDDDTAFVIESISIVFNHTRLFTGSTSDGTHVESAPISDDHRVARYDELGAASDSTSPTP